jgi:uncharacterized protein (DUF934 family)
MAAKQAIFTVLADQIMFMTRSNGDHIEMRNHLTEEAAANLAALINSGKELEVRIKKVSEEE